MTQKYVIIETIKAFKNGLFQDLNEMVNEANIVTNEMDNTEINSDLDKPYKFIKKLSKKQYKSFESVQKNAKKVLNEFYK